MGRVHRSFLPGTRIYACSNCRAHLTNHEDIVSKSFQGRTGRAYLFNTVVNVTLGPVEDRILTTGLHKVCTLSTSKLPPLRIQIRSALRVSAPEHAVCTERLGQACEHLCGASPALGAGQRRRGVPCVQAAQETVILRCVQVQDIYCNCCDLYLGWKYEEAFEQSQKVPSIVPTLAPLRAPVHALRIRIFGIWCMHSAPCDSV